MTMQELRISNEHELFCPICQEKGECPHHLVEKWQEGERYSYLLQWIGNRTHAVEWETKLLAQFGTIEECFPHQMIGVSWTAEDFETLTPLFSGHAISKKDTLREWKILFHPKGKAILQQYQERIEKFLLKFDQIQRIVGMLQTESATSIIAKENIALPTNSFSSAEQRISESEYTRGDYQQIQRVRKHLEQIKERQEQKAIHTKRFNQNQSSSS